MSETWRRKTYYDPRVLIDVDRVLDPQFADSLVCLTGAQQEMLRNLTAYLKRRSTWVAEYHDGFYLAPDNDDWVTIQALVAELEDTLMGCTDIVAALQCICDAITQLQGKAGLPVDSIVEDQPSYDDYLSSVIEDQGDPPGDWETWDAWRVQKCISAQKVIDDIIASMETISGWVGAGLVIGVVAVNAALAASAIVPPLAIVLAAASVLAVVGMAQIQEEAQLFMAEHKEALVCLMFNATSALQARTAVHAYLDSEWDVEGSPTYVKYLLNDLTLSRMYDGVMPDYETWAGDYSAEYCDDCNGESIVGFDETWPPCEGSMFLGTGFCATNGRKCAYNLGGTGWLGHEFILGDPEVHASCSLVEWDISWYSSRGDDYPAGWLRLYKWDTDHWVQLVNRQMRVVGADALNTPTVTTGDQNYSLPDPGDLCRWAILVSPIEGAVYPTSIMLGTFQCDFTMVDI